MQLNKVGNCFKGLCNWTRRETALGGREMLFFFIQLAGISVHLKMTSLFYINSQRNVQLDSSFTACTFDGAGKIEPSWTFLWCVPESVKAVWHWPMGTTLSQSLWNAHTLTLLQPSHKYEANAYTHTTITQTWSKCIHTQHHHTNMTGIKQVCSLKYILSKQHLLACTAYKDEAIVDELRWRDRYIWRWHNKE